MERGGPESVNTVLVNSVMGESMEASCFSSKYSSGFLSPPTPQICILEVW